MKKENTDVFFEEAIDKKGTIFFFLKLEILTEEEILLKQQEKKNRRRSVFGVVLEPSKDTTQIRDLNNTPPEKTEKSEKRKSLSQLLIDKLRPKSTTPQQSPKTTTIEKP